MSILTQASDSWRVYPPLSLRDISPSRGEIDPRRSHALQTGSNLRQMPMAGGFGGHAQPISPLEREMSDRTEGGEAPDHKCLEVRK